MPVKYQGSKSRYAGKIASVLSRFTKPGEPLWEVCCGTAAVSRYMNKPLRVVDAGPWGRFWKYIEIIQSREDTPRYHQQLKMAAAQYNSFVHSSRVNLVPETPITYCLAFLALQHESFSGKPVGTEQGFWKHPGFGPKFSVGPFIKGAKLAITTRVSDARYCDGNNFVVPDNCLVYVDPDYSGTTGYNGLRFNVSRFVSRNRHCTIAVSHDVPIVGIEWDEVHDVRVDTKHRTYSVSDSECLLIKYAEEK